MYLIKVQSHWLTNPKDSVLFGQSLDLPGLVRCVS